MLDRLPIGYDLPDFQLIWKNFKIDTFQLQIALNPYEFWRAIFYPTSDDHQPMGYSLPDFQPIWSNFFAAHPPAAAALTWKKGVDTKGDQNQPYYRSNPIGVLTQNMTRWQMIAYR